MNWTGLTSLITLLVIGIIYFIPAIVAVNRNHINTLAIFMLTLLVGWTAVGWVIALVWACTNRSK